MKKDHPEALEWLAYTFEKQRKNPIALSTWNTLLRCRDLPQEKIILASEHIQLIMVKIEFGENVNADSLMADGKKFHEAKKYDEALKRFLLVLRIQNNHPDAIEWVAYTCEKKNMYTQALNAWNTLLKTGDLSENKREQVQKRVKKISTHLNKMNSRKD